MSDKLSWPLRTTTATEDTISQVMREPPAKRGFSNNVPMQLDRLTSLKPGSEEFLGLFDSFFTTKDNSKVILALSDEDAKVFIEIINVVLRITQVDGKVQMLVINVLRNLCGRTEYLPESYLLSDKFNLSGVPHASSGSSDVLVEFLKGKRVAVKSLRISEMGDKTKIRKRFCKEVATWMNLSHPNVLKLIGVSDTFKDGKLSMVSEWMVNGNILEYVRANAGNHLSLLAGAIEGLEYLHDIGIAHGNLKSANILITNATPISSCLADFGLMAIFHEPDLEMASSTSDSEGGTTPFMAPELLVPSKFGLEKCTSTAEADIYGMAMVVYQVLTGTIPFGNLPRHTLPVMVLDGERPSKPANALKLGLSDEVWVLLQNCWETQRALRPSIAEVSIRIKSAASVCGTLPPIKDMSREHMEPDLDLGELGLLGMPFNNEDIGVYGLSIEADHVISLLKGRSGDKGFLDLEYDEAQTYADILDASLSERNLDNQTQSRYFGCLKRLCSALGTLPSSFILADAFDGQEATPLGKGGYGSVSKMSFMGRCVAVKTLSVTEETGGIQRVYKLLASEVVAWKWLQHENILPFVGVTRGFAIVSDFMESGNIMDFIAKHPSHNRLHLLIGSTRGLKYLHSQNIVHGDLKGANILIDSTHSARLGDFGLTTIIDEPTAGITTGGRGPKGTTRWMAPEMMYPERFAFTGNMQEQLPSKSTDIYALGMTTLEVLTGKRPFNNLAREISVIFAVTGGKKPDRPPWGFSDDMWDLLFDVWDPEYGSQPSRRPSILSILNQMEEDAEDWDQFVVSLRQQQVKDGEAASSDPAEM